MKKEIVSFVLFDQKKTMTQASKHDGWWWWWFHAEKLLAYIDIGLDENVPNPTLCPAGYGFTHVLIHAPPALHYSSMVMLHEYIRSHAAVWMNQQVTIFFDLEEQRFIVTDQSPVGSARG